jgi:hypothetical protein
MPAMRRMRRRITEPTARAHDRQHLLLEHGRHLARPGQQEEQRRRSRPDCPGAEPRALGITVPPSMRSACFSFTGAITRP